MYDKAYVNYMYYNIVFFGVSLRKQMGKIKEQKAYRKGLIVSSFLILFISYLLGLIEYAFYGIKGMLIGIIIGNLLCLISIIILFALKETNG